MFSVDRSDVDRLLNANKADFLKRRPDLDELLKNAQQPPELGIASEDDFKKVMLEGVLKEAGCRLI